MVIVAVAGGTGAVGQTIVKALVDSGNNRVFILSRTTKRNDRASELHHLVIDYQDVNQVQQVLRQNHVEVVVSALLLVDQQALLSQINLIRGAASSGTVTKFIPSEYHLDFHKPVKGLEMLFRKFQLDSEHELAQHPELTWTLIRNGLFLDYLGMPAHPRPTSLMKWCIFVDLQHQRCVFPGNGDQVMIFTHSADLAAYIERLVNLPAAQWPRKSLIQPNKIILKDLAKIAEEVTGRKFHVVYDSVESIHNDQITPLPSNKELFAHPSWGNLYKLVEKETMFALLSNGYDLDGTDLKGLFPDVKTTNLKDFLKQSWELL